MSAKKMCHEGEKNNTYVALNYKSHFSFSFFFLEMYFTNCKMFHLERQVLITTIEYRITGCIGVRYDKLTH